MAGASSKSVVVAALFANAAITVLKFSAFLLTGSASMLSETYHSISDTGNQLLLLVGLQFSGRKATRQHPFGWGKAEFFYGFVVAMLLFAIAGWESLWEGVHQIRILAGEGAAAATDAVGGAAGAAAEGAAEGAAGHDASTGHLVRGQVQLLGFTFTGIWVNYAVLAGAFAFESYALTKALHGMREIQRLGRYGSLWETFRKAKSAAILTAFTEDLLALTGLAIAAVALGVSQVTGDPVWDAVGAVLIGVMLMAFALLLAWEQKRLLVGEAMELWQEEEIGGILRGRSEVHDVDNLRTVYFGTNNVLLTADLRFDPALTAAHVEDIVDELEAEVRERFPRLRAVYLETDVDDEPVAPSTT